MKAAKLVAAKSTAAVAETAAMALVAQLPYQNANIRRVAFGKGLRLPEAWHDWSRSGCKKRDIALIVSSFTPRLACHTPVLECSGYSRARKAMQRHRISRLEGTFMPLRLIFRSFHPWTIRALESMWLRLSRMIEIESASDFGL